MTQAPAPSLRIGRVIKAHGLDGTVEVESLTDFPERFQPGTQVSAGERTLTVAFQADKDGVLLLRFAEIADRTAAAALRDAYLTVPLEEAKALPADHYYHFQLVGLRVVDAATERTVGTVEEVLAYPANDVLRVKHGAREVLIPMARAIVRAIDPAAGQILVDLPEEAEAGE